MIILANLNIFCFLCFFLFWVVGCCCFFAARRTKGTTGTLKYSLFYFSILNGDGERKRSKK